MSTQVKYILLRLAFAAFCILCTIVAMSQATGDYLFQRKTAGAFTSVWLTPNSTDIITFNGAGLLTKIPRTTYMTPAQVAAGYQPLSATLTALAGLATTAYGRGLLIQPNAAAARAYLGVVAGTGDVVGPASAVDGHIVQFDGVTGKLIKDGLATSTGGSGAADAGKVLVFNSEGEIAASSTAGQNAVSGLVASGPGAGVYAENNGTGNAVVGIAVGGGIGGVFLATGAEGVTATSDTQPGGSFTNASAAEPALHVQNNDATNAGDLFHFHNDANQGVEGGNDGTLNWTTATGAQGTATNLPVFGALTKGVVPAAGAVPAATNFLTETGTFAVPAGTGIQDGDVLTLGLTFPNQGLEILDTGGGQSLTIAANENLSADRKLNIIINDANKTLTVAADATVSNTNTGDVTIGTANGLSLAGQALSLGLSSTSTTGALSDTDWDTFNNKQAALTLGTGVTTALSNNADSPSGFVTQTGGDARYAPIAPLTYLAYASGSQATTSTSLGDVAGTSFTLGVGAYRIEYRISYDAAATTTGAYFSVNGTAVFPTNELYGKVFYRTVLTEYGFRPFGAFNGGVTSASSLGTASNNAVMEVTINVTTGGTFFLRWATEVGGSAITITDVHGYAQKLD